MDAYSTNGRVHYLLQLACSSTRPSTDSCRRSTDAVAMIQTVVLLSQNVGITLDERGRVPVNEQLQTSVPKYVYLHLTFLLSLLSSIFFLLHLLLSSTD